MSDENKTLRKIAFTIAFDIPLPPEGSPELAASWGGATTHEQALQHEIEFYRDQDGDLMELASFIPYEVVSGRIVEDV